MAAELPDIQRILALLYRVVDSTNAQQESGRKLAKAEDAVIVGERGVLDSLGTVTLLVAAEDAVEDAFGRRVRLLSEDLMADHGGPLRTLGALAEYVVKQLRT